MLRLFQKRGLLDDHTVADMLTWQGAGGFSLDASVRIHGSSAGRERLLRYCARPPFALERLRVQRHTAATGRDSRHSKTTVRQVLYHPPRPTPDGRTVLVLSPLEFLAALARLIPPPHIHRHRYHGVLAPHARLRERVTALGRGDGEDQRSMSGPAPESGDGDMRILAFLTEPEPVDVILRHLDLPATPPPISPARGPPQSDLEFDAEHTLELDQTPSFDPAEPEPDRDLEFDQSRGG